MSEEPEAETEEAADVDEPEPEDDVETADAEAADAEAADAEAADAEAAEIEDADGASPEEGDAEGLQDGDFVRLEYTMRTVEDGQLVDTTDEEIAEEEGVDTDEGEFGPRTIVLGAGHVFGAVEDDLIGKEVGDAGAVTIPPAEAFGEYDPEQVRTVSAEKLPEDSRHPGAHVDVDGEHGHVETIIGGRARVDFNHPLAGEEIEYEYEVLDVVEDRLERARALFSAYLDLDLDVSIGTEEDEEPVYDDEGEQEGTETVEYETLYVEATPQLTMNQQWMFQKQQIAQEVMDRIGVDRVVIRETIDGGGMMGGMGGMMGGLGGDVDADELEEAIEEADLDEADAEDVVEELEDAGE